VQISPGRKKKKTVDQQCEQSRLGSWIEFMFVSCALHKKIYIFVKILLKIFKKLKQNYS